PPPPEKNFLKKTAGGGGPRFLVAGKRRGGTPPAQRRPHIMHRAAAQLAVGALGRSLLGVEAVHTIGYCVAGTTLAATLAFLEAKGRANEVKSATFFTAQVDFEDAGDLKLFLGDETM